MKRSYLKRGSSQLKRSGFRVPGTARVEKPKYRTLKAKPESPEDRAWKKAVRERDGYRCQWPECDVESRHIHAHHIHSRKQRPELRHDVSNGAALCFKHHDHLHHTVEGRQRAREIGLLGTETYEAARKLKAA